MAGPVRGWGEQAWPQGIPRLGQARRSFASTGFPQEYNHLRGQGFLTSDGPHLLAGLGFDTDPIDGQVQELGDALPHQSLVGTQLGLLGENNGIHIDEGEPGFSYPLPSQLEHFGGISPPVGLVRVGKQLADIAQTGRAQQGIRQGMEQDIGVTMSNRLPAVRHVNPAHAERASGFESMRIVSQADSQPSQSMLFHDL